MSAAARAIEVQKRYGRVRALAGVSLEIPESSLVLLSGPNGAGKSTLLRILAGLTRPTRGEAEILGKQPYGSQHAAVRGEVGYLGAAPALYADLTVRENLDFYAELRGTNPYEVDRQLDSFDLQSVAGRIVANLSSGFQRRVGLARSFLGDPKLLLLDEPWNALDLAASEKVQEALLRARARGATAVVAAHGASDAIFDLEVVLTEGRIGKVS